MASFSFPSALQIFFYIFIFNHYLSPIITIGGPIDALLILHLSSLSYSICLAQKLPLLLIIPSTQVQQFDDIYLLGLLGTLLRGALFPFETHGWRKTHFLSKKTKQSRDQSTQIHIFQHAISNVCKRTLAFYTSIIHMQQLVFPGISQLLFSSSCIIFSFRFWTSATRSSQHMRHGFY